jgi:hypothetical protein
MITSIATKRQNREEKYARVELLIELVDEIRRKEKKRARRESHHKSKKKKIRKEKH